jgi:hypothetical protein
VQHDGLPINRMVLVDLGEQVHIPYMVSYTTRFSEGELDYMLQQPKGAVNVLQIAPSLQLHIYKW